MEIYCFIPSLLFFSFKIKQEGRRKKGGWVGGGRRKREGGRKKGEWKGGLFRRE